eukprot:4721271-Prymnesium_polylepis.1
MKVHPHSALGGGKCGRHTRRTTLSAGSTPPHPASSRHCPCAPDSPLSCNDKAAVPPSLRPAMRWASAQVVAPFTAPP